MTILLICFNSDPCWKPFLGWHIRGGRKIKTIDLGDCQAQCLQNADCVSVDFNPTSGGCWLLKTTENKEADAKIEHYDFVCDGKYTNR